jgi:hypothetical protein
VSSVVDIEPAPAAAAHCRDACPGSRAAVTRLRQKAARWRRVALDVTDDITARSLVILAANMDRQADDLEAGHLPRAKHPDCNAVIQMDAERVAERAGSRTAIYDHS